MIPASNANREAWQVLLKFDKPFLTAFSDSDPITGGGDRLFLEKVPGTKGQPHTTIKGGRTFPAGGPRRGIGPGDSELYSKNVNSFFATDKADKEGQKKKH